MSSETLKMIIEYDSFLIEEVVFQEVKRRERTSDFNLFETYHRQANPIYEKFSLAEREAKFEKLHKRLFLKLGFGKICDETIAEVHGLRSKIEAVIIRKAITEREEEADLSKDLKSIGIKILIKRFLNPSDLQKLLRHELKHVSDMLDKQFGYESREKLIVYSPEEENIIRDRYRILWDIYIDSRLIREGKKTISDKHGRYQEFEAYYQKIPDSHRISIFENIWQGEKLTHDQILEMAKDTGKLMLRFGAHLSTGEVPDLELLKKKIKLPGSLCPLCRFPTYNSIDEIDRLDESVIKLIQEDYSDWQAEEGACERCIESYALKEGQ